MARGILSSVSLVLVAALLALALSPSSAALLARATGSLDTKARGGLKAFSADSPLARSSLVVEAGDLLCNGRDALGGKVRELHEGATLVAKGVTAGVKKALDYEKYPKLFAAGSHSPWSR